MRLNERLKIRFGMSTKEVAKCFGLTTRQLVDYEKSRPKVFELALKGLDIGSKWVDFQDKLEAKGIILIEANGKVSYSKNLSQLSKFCWTYGIGSVANLSSITDLSYPTLKSWSESKKLFLQYILFGASYYCRYRNVKSALDETVFKGEENE